MYSKINKAFCSGITKTIAVILLAACFGAALLTVSQIVKYSRDYSFGESDYTEGVSSRQEIYSAVWTIMTAAKDNNTDSAEIQKLMANKKADYYAEYGGNIYTNDPALASFPLNGCYYYAIRENGEWITGGIREMYFSKEDAPSADCRIYVRLTDSFSKTLETEWLTAKNYIIDAFTVLAITAAIAFALLVYLLFVCGRRCGDNEIHTMTIDALPAEIIAAALFGCTAVFLIATGYALTEIDSAPEIAPVFAVFISALSLLPLSLALSFARILKSSKLRKKAIVCRIYRFLKNSVKQIRSAADSRILKKSALSISAIVFVYMLALMFVLFATESVILPFIMAVFGAVYVLKKLSSADEIIKGITELKNGNSLYKIPKQSGVLSEIAESVNSIGDGINQAVEIKLKSERMKSELITNVSHDLKTPLTSIINYSDLLCKEQLVPEKANEYARIISEKSERLKKITSDLFDISKVQSGNANIKAEKIDAALLMKQALGELDGEIKNSNLEFIVNADAACTAIGDGEKLSRVFENIIANAAKYSLKGSRVYVTVKNEPQSVFAEVKNISSYPMNFDTNEITERFVRGDASRSGDGNGLGLAIAKSYTEACGGSFSITTDGDLFKCVIHLPKKIDIH